MQNQQTPLDRIKSMALCAQRKHLDDNDATVPLQAPKSENQPEVAMASMLRHAPAGDAQRDLFAPPMWDISTKDSQSMMDVAVFRLSKRDKRPGETIHYELADGYIEVKAGPDGMASVWDYDIILMAISYLTEAMNRHREGRCEMPTRLIRPSVMEILKFCRRPVGGRQYEELESTLDRLKNTTLKIVRTRKGRNGRVIRMAEGEGLLSNYRVLSYAENGKVASVELEVPNWIYREVVQAQQPEILTIHPDYFLIEPGIGRYLYRLARRVAGRGRARWSFKLIYERSGSTGTFKEFCRMLRKQIQINDLPEYVLTEEPGKTGPMLVIVNREASIDDKPVESEE
ncbi:replication initiator protein A [Pusillimonas minor]|uniref:Replication initiator protein A n=1 Tax=Pusillimonas minor TaxID=2697024 RepID=A0A842HLI4_9BURK|nr:replication initiator protein A [Pusillimonas minor]MBC2768784.1 replication initiator protein A [Pusillimonas minor]